MKRSCLLLVSLVWILSGVGLSAVTISPSNPTTADEVQVTVSGWWGDSCVPNMSTMVVTGHEIHFVVDNAYSPGMVCLTVVSPWQLTENAGQLAAGSYTVFVTHEDNPGVFLVPPLTFEVSDKRFEVSPDSLRIDEGSQCVFTVRLLQDPQGPVTATVWRHSGDTDISILAGATLSFDSSNYQVPQPVTLAAAEDDDPLNGTAVIYITASRYVTSAVSVTETDNDIPSVLYVDQRAVGTGNGASWADAFTNLREALEYAAEYPEVEEVRVAQGIYRPAEPGGDRNACFRPIGGAILMGGFAGVSRANPDERNINHFETVLSGDLNGDDGPDFANYEDNCFNVVVGSDETVLDGVTISGGHGIGGAGMLIYNYDPVLMNCTFRDNLANYGAAVRCHNANPVFINCLFVNNCAVRDSIADGGAICCANENGTGLGPVLTNCTLVGNRASETGGGIQNALASMPTLNNCILWQNSDGGGMDESSHLSGAFTLNHCCVQGWTGTRQGVGCFGDDPVFVVGPLGDFYLSQTAGGQAVESPCVNAGDSPAADLGLDALVTSTNSMPDSGIVDLGYHYEPTHCTDLNRDGRVNGKDFYILASQWKGGPAGSFSADIGPAEGDGVVDLQDLTMLTEYWLW